MDKAIRSRFGGWRFSVGSGAQPGCKVALGRVAFAKAAFGVAALGFAALVIGAHPRPAAAADVLEAAPVEVETGPVRHVVVTLNKSRTFKIDRPFVSAIVGQPDIADVLPLTDSSIYVQGKKVGTTNISIFDPKKQLIAVLDLEVTPDTASLRNKVVSSTGGQGIQVSSANGEVVLSGEATDAVAASRAMAVAKGLAGDAPVIDAMKVAPSQQVMLKVRFLEVSRTAERGLGMNWTAFNGRTAINTGLPTPGTTPPTLAGIFPGSNATPFGTLLTTAINGNHVHIDALLTALEDKGLVRKLAEPDLMALSGDTASFLAGGQIPVPVVQSTSGTVPTITVEWKSFGVQLTFQPTVLNNGLINLRLTPSVSEIDTANTVQISGFTIPTLITREARTTVELRDGQSFGIAGLLQTTNSNAVAQLPYLGQIPVLGALFRSADYQKQETELVIIVTPHLVRPGAPGNELQSPLDATLPANDADLFAMGDLDRKKLYRDYVTKGGNLNGPYGHMLEPPDPPGK